MFNLPKLPYDFDALEPHIDAQTMEIHYTKHHQGYTDKLNTALESYSGLREKSIEELLKNLGDLPQEVATAVRNNGGGFFNHSIFWSIMSPEETNPSKDILSKLEVQFGSFDEFKEEFSAKAATVFGSGWTWLVVHPDEKLEVIQSPNQDNPIMTLDIKPLLGIDVWEHAYYLKYQNKRPDYIKTWWNVVNWEEVENRLSN